MAAIQLTIQFKVSPENIQTALKEVERTMQRVGVETASTASSTSKLANEFDKSKFAITTFDDLATKVGFRLQAFQNMFSVLSSTFGEFVRESNASEAATAKLTQALENQGLFSQQLVEDLKAFAAERQTIAAIDDDATVAILGQLTALGLQGQALRDATVAVQDLATLMDGDMNSAVRLVADAFQGNTQGLKRMKIEIDEAALKERGAIVVIEALTKAVGGQAAAFGNTAAGALKKLQLAQDDLRQSLGDLLKDSLAPFTEMMRNIVEWINTGGNAAKFLALGLTGLAVTFAFLNTAMGPWPYILTAAATALLAIYKAAKDGEGVLVALGGAVGAVALAFVLLHGKAIAAAVSMTGVSAGFVTARAAATAFFTSIGPLGWAMVALGAVAAGWGLIQRNTDGATAAANQYRDAIRGVSREKLNMLIADTILAIAETTNRIDELTEAAKKNRREGKIHQDTTDIDSARLKLESLQQQLTQLKEESQVRATQAIADDLAKEADRSKVNLVLRRQQIELMEDGYEKERAEILLTFAEKVQSIRSGSEFSKSQQEEIIAGYARIRDAKLKALDANAVELTPLKPKDIDPKFYPTKPITVPTHLEPIPQSQVDAMQDWLTESLAQGEARRLRIERAAAEERRRLWEEDHRVAVAFIDSIAAGSATMWQQFVVGNRQAKDEWDAVWLSMRNTALTALGAMLTEYIRTKLVESAMRKADVAEHAVAEGTKTATTEAGALERVAIAVWEGLKKAATWVWETATFIAEEAARTAFAGVQAALRIAGTIAESVVKIGVWVAEQAAFVAKEIAMTAIFLAQQAIRVAAALAEAAASIVKAVAQAIAASGPFALFTAAAFTALGVAAFRGLKAAFGFEKGGVFEPDQHGFIEGGQYEIIAPRRSFIEVFRTDIAPQAVKELDLQRILERVVTTIVSVAPQLAYATSGSNYDMKRLERRLDRLVAVVDKKDWSPVFENLRNEQVILRKEGPKAERARKAMQR